MWSASTYSIQPYLALPPFRALLSFRFFLFFYRGHRALKSDLRMRPVAERLRRRAAAAAQRAFHDRNRISLRIGECEITFDDVRAVIANLDGYAHQNIGFAAV